MILPQLSRQNTSSPLSLAATLLTRHLSTAASRLRDHYCFKPPPSLTPGQPTSDPPPIKKKQKPQYRPPSSLDNIKKIKSELPFDFRFSYTESSTAVRPIGLREPKYSPFGPGRVDRPWTGVCAPAVDPKVTSLDGVEDPNLEKKRSWLRKTIQGAPLTAAERKILVDKCHRDKTKKQINLDHRVTLQQRRMRVAARRRRGSSGRRWRSERVLREERRCRWLHRH